MASTLEELIQEITQVHEAISDYSDSLGAYVMNPSSPFPELDQSKLVIDTLETYSRNNKDSSVDLVSGAMSSVVQKVAAISRELSIRSQTKAMLYDLAVGEASTATEEVRGEAGKKVAQTRSMTPSQSEGT